MSIEKHYRQKNSSELASAERRYDVWPLPEGEPELGINKLCLKETCNIARQKSRNHSTQKSEQRLQQYRNYGIKQTPNQPQ